ncbi:CarD family transcriptional regulator [Lysinibacillus sp. BW-2-10]|uniref:CarD family transcriptional regulator n=1 Tax=Lysinibacillus sp. BW-2-10 TaxID=2590030 RepID=UPI00117F945C|nr:CarD family transcriptional regulator [Lysinibacillus sp. BW-2-10]TSI03135.1 CarD family transcriptional regulator [Lysinibacillus sp. BW-2-10]
MFNIGDKIIYSSHGLCCIDDITEKTFSGVTKTYYVLHPLDNEKLQINAPIDNKSISMLEVMNKEEAEEILFLFTLPGIEWIDKSHQRIQIYNSIVKKGNRKEIAKIINTLMIKKHELESEGKKFPEFDRKLLVTIQHILFNELALSLKTTIDTIHQKVEKLLHIYDEAVTIES